MSKFLKKMNFIFYDVIVRFEEKVKSLKERTNHEDWIHISFVQIGQDLAELGQRQLSDMTVRLCKRHVTITSEWLPKAAAVKLTLIQQHIMLRQGGGILDPMPS